MISHPRSSCLPVLLFVLALSAGCANAAFAQDIPGGTPPPAGKTPGSAENDFLFPGGSPIDFLQALQKQYGVDLMSLADISPGIDRAHVPKLRIPAARPLSNIPQPLWQLDNMIALYNQLAKDDPRLGKLFVQSSGTNVIAVTLRPLPTTDVARVEIKTRAFPLAGIPEAKWSELTRVIGFTQLEIQNRPESRGQLGEMFGPPSVSIHKSSELLIAVGSETYIDLVGSIVDAWRANAASETPGQFTVLGAVNRPGRFAIRRSAPVNILEALGEAGGTTPHANLGNVVVQREVDGEMKQFRINIRSSGTEKPFELQPNDIVTVPESKF